LSDILISPIYTAFIFVFGTLLGSFANVLIYRLPRGENFVFKRSSCPHCKAVIPFYLNIPIIAWIGLRGKCKNCKGSISLRYPLVEFIIGVVAVLLLKPEFELTLIFLNIIKLSIAIVLICHIFIDLEHRLLLDSLNIYLGAIILSYVAFYFSWQKWLLGALMGFLFPAFISWAFYKLRGIVGLGGGDIKLWGILGLYLGPIGIFQNMFLSCFVGTLIALILIMFKKYDKKIGLPFGPFIIIAFFLQFSFPEEVNRLFQFIYS
jgi:prepilin signal peptidase PulO-like enzyme (type II secretory pathway)